MRNDIPAIISLLLVIGCAKPAQPLPVKDEPEPVGWTKRAAKAMSSATGGDKASAGSETGDPAFK